jgi:hypothetical protein
VAPHKTYRLTPAEIVKTTEPLALLTIVNGTNDGFVISNNESV